MHDGSDGRAFRLDGRPPEGAAGFGIDQLVTAFQEVASGVEGTHRMLIERVERLSRDLEQARSAAAGGGHLACDGEVTLETIERRAILATLERFGGHRDRTARALGIGVRTLGMKLRRWKDAGLVRDTV